MTSKHLAIQTERRRLIQPLWTAFDRHLRSGLKDGVVLAVSGGSDSLALLEAYARWRYRPEGNCVVVTIDHGTRSSSARQADEVAARGRARGFDVEVRRIDGQGKNEAELRRLRYEVLQSVGTQLELRTVVTAHHADDDAEGWVMNALGWGGGIDGAAMPMRRPLADGVTLVRPFARLQRTDLALARSAMQTYRVAVDEDDERGRNQRARIRHRVMPALEAAEPAARRRLQILARRQLGGVRDVGQADSGATSLRVGPGEEPQSLRAKIGRLIATAAGAGRDPRDGAHARDIIVEAIVRGIDREKRFAVPGGSIAVRPGGSAEISLVVENVRADDGG